MKLEDVKDSIDLFFDSKTKEELKILFDKYKPKQKFNVGDKVKFTTKNEFYTNIRLGSIGQVLDVKKSPLGETCWVKFKKGTTWMYSNQLNKL